MPGCFFLLFSFFIIIHFAFVMSVFIASVYRFIHHFIVCLYLLFMYLLPLCLSFISYPSHYDTLTTTSHGVTSSFLSSCLFISHSILFSVSFPLCFLFLLLFRYRLCIYNFKSLLACLSGSVSLCSHASSPVFLSLSSFGNQRQECGADR